MFDKLPTLKSPGDTIDDLNARARDAADTLSRLPGLLLVTGPHDLPGVGQRRAGLQGRIR